MLFENSGADRVRPVMADACTIEMMKSCDFASPPRLLPTLYKT